ncbi:LysE/ArgO family amino acid transporter [Pseudodesulfovibrio sp.]|uniref:LysE/ArgO family amino acid transporter n=1 Tax=unclassified Pseudodesulfovibrio TaxID=2661612 RepID=UPI003AFF7E2D
MIVAWRDGIRSVMASSPWLMQVAAWGGAAFWGWYGLGAFRSARRGGAMQTGTVAEETLGHTVLLMLAVTLLNPHVYLDTVVLMGSVSGRIPIPGRYWFGAGAITASTLWFLALTAGGRLLAPLFGRSSTWRVLDIVVGLTMWGVAASLLMSLHSQ